MAFQQAPEQVLASQAQMRKEMIGQAIDHTVIAMALLQSYSPYKGADEVLKDVDKDTINTIRGRLYATGYLQRDVGSGQIKLSSLGEHALKLAMAGAAKNETSV